MPVFRWKLKYQSSYEAPTSTGGGEFTGARATILPNVKICDNVFIAAGAVVTRSITESGIYGGVPAKKIGDFDKIYKKRLEYKKNIYDKDEALFHKKLWKYFHENY